MNTQQAGAPTQETMFPNLYRELKKELVKRFNDFKENLNSETSVENILNKYQYRDLLTKTDKAKEWSLPDLKTRVIERKTLKLNKDLQNSLNELLMVEVAPELKKINVSIEWKKSRMWGSNPRADASITTSNGYERYDSGSIGGCGYDKESTAFAHAVNNCLALKKALYIIREKNIKKPLRDLIGYGSGYGVLPYLEGGVGVSCYYKIFEAIGFKMEQVGNGKMYNAYLITKK